MKNKPITNLSLRKFLLAVLVAGPLAILPVPLWAIPSVASGNLSVSTGVTVAQPSANTLNITAPDKAVLTWADFGGVAQPINAADTLNYFLPPTGGSVLNLVTSTGAAFATTINGSIISNGNVYLLNPNGIVIGTTANINVGGFYASTINEPLAASGFGLNGKLSFSGPTPTANVTVNGGTIQAVGTGNNVYLYGAQVDVNAANVYGNLTINSMDATKGVTFTGSGMQSAGVAWGGSVAINKLAGSGGNLTVNTNGGSVNFGGPGTPGGVNLGRTGESLDATTATFTAGAGYVASTNIPVLLPGPEGSSRNTSRTGVQASGYMTTNATGQITGFVITNGGDAYTNSKDATVPSPGAAFANTTVPLVGTGVSTAVGAITVAFAGAGYPANSTVPVTFSQPLAGGTRATGYATTNATGNVTGIVVTNAGSGYVIAPQVLISDPGSNSLTVAGNATINTTSSVANANGGSIAQPNDSSRVTITGTTSINTGATGTGSPGTVSLTNVDLGTLTIPSAGSTVVSDQSGGLVLGNITITATKAFENLKLSGGATNSGSALTMASGAKVSVLPSATEANPAVNLTGASVTFTGTGPLIFSGLSTSTSSGSLNITGDNNISRANSAGTAQDVGGKTVNITTTGGTITIGSLSTTSASGTLKASGDIVLKDMTTSGSLTVESTTGAVTVGNLTLGGSSSLKAVNDITFGSAGATSGITMTSSAGQITGGAISGQGTLTAATNISLAKTTNTASIDRTGINAPTSSSSKVVVGAPNAYITTTSVSDMANGVGYTPNTTFNVNSGTATAQLVSNASGQISSVNILAAGATVNRGIAFTVPAPTNAVVASGALTLTATNGSIMIADPIISTTTAAVTIKAAQNVSLPTTTAPVLSVTSTGGSITQTGAITSTSKATFDAATDILLTTATNDLNQVVFLNAGGTQGVNYVGANAVTLGGGTATKGNVSITTGAGVTPFATSSNNVVIGTVDSPLLNAAVRFSTSGSAGIVTGSSTVVAGTGYVASAAAPATIPLTVSAPPASVGIPAFTTNATPAAPWTPPTANTLLISGGTLVGVVLPKAIGNGFTPNSTVPITFADATVGAVLPVGVANVNGNGQITSVTLTSAGSGLTAGALSMTVAAPAASVTETAGLITDSVGKVTGVALTGNGTGYYGSFTPVVTAVPAAAAGTTATIVGITNAAGALTGITVTGSGSGYSSTPNVTLTNGAKASVTLLNGTLGTAAAAGSGTVSTNITPVQNAALILGSAATDKISIAGNLTLSTSTAPAGTAGVGSASAAWSQINTVANEIYVGGNVTLNTGGTDAFLGLNPVGSVAKYSFGAINGNVGTGTMNINENLTLNLGTITAKNVSATSIGSNIVNSGPLTITGALNVFANSIFNPGDVTLNNAYNNISGTVYVGNANNVTFYNNGANAKLNAGANDLYTGFALQGKAVTGTASVSVPAGRTITMAQTPGTSGDFNIVSFNALNGAVTISDQSGFTVQNAVNAGTGTVLLEALGPITLGSGIALKSTGATTINSLGSAAAITDSAPNISIYGAVVMNSENNISLTQAGHSLGPVSMLTSGGTGASATINTDAAGNLSSIPVVGSTSYGSGYATNTNFPVTIGYGSNASAAGSFIANTDSLGRITSFSALPSATTALTPGSTYVVSSVGNLTAAQWTTFTGGALVAVPVAGTKFVAGAGSAAVVGGTSTVYGAGTGYPFSWASMPVTVTPVAAANYTGYAATKTDITYTEAGTANLNAVRVNVNGAGAAGSLAVTSSSGNIIQTPLAGYIQVPTVAGATNTVSFSAPNGAVTLTNPVGTSATLGNKIAPAISLTASTDSTIAQSRAGISLGNVTVTNGAFTADASTASAGYLPYAISQTAGSKIFSYGASTFKTNGAAITLTNDGNNFGAITAITNNGLAPVAATSAAAPTVAAGVAAMGTYLVPAGTAGNSYTPASTAIGVTVTDTLATGNSAVASATTNDWGQVTSIQLTNGGNSFTGVVGLALAAPAATANAALGGAVSITEAGTMNLSNVNTGTTGTITAVSSGGGIIESSAPGLTIGGAASFTAQSAGITLNSGNTFSSTITLNSTGNVIIQDGSASTVISTGTGNIGGTLTVRNDRAGGGAIGDVVGGKLDVAGNVLFDAGIGNINITGSNNTFGGLAFRGATVNITENTTLNLAGVSVATGPVSLASNADIVTSGSGTSTFSFAGVGATSVTLTAGGNITVSNPFYAANGLTFRALGAVDLSAMSLLNNLNNKAPTDLGRASYKAPGP